MAWEKSVPKEAISGFKDMLSSNGFCKIVQLKETPRNLIGSIMMGGNMNEDGAFDLMPGKGEKIGTITQDDLTIFNNPYPIVTAFKATMCSENNTPVTILCSGSMMFMFYVNPNLTKYRIKHVMNAIRYEELKNGGAGMNVYLFYP
ncbi:MAG: hypothetical protein JNL74_23265 [Fibrobacteres bacterium]|nr:hypothetical protein [Fibrobacterota bacterium]